MIQIDERLCVGCGACADVCPRRAISLDSGVAAWSAERCNDCGACVDACPQRAILLVETVLPEMRSSGQQPVSHVPAPGKTAPPVPPATRCSTSFWPLMDAFLRWAGMELTPRLTNVALKLWSRCTTGDRLSHVGGLRTVSASHPWRHRHRRRGRS